MFIKLFFTPHYSPTTGQPWGYTALVVNLLTDRRTQQFFFADQITQACIAAWQDGQLIQSAFPNLEKWEQEFLISGLPYDEQEKIFGQPN